MEAAKRGEGGMGGSAISLESVDSRGKLEKARKGESQGKGSLNRGKRDNKMGKGKFRGGNEHKGTYEKNLRDFGEKAVEKGGKKKKRGTKWEDLRARRG